MKSDTLAYAHLAVPRDDKLGGWKCPYCGANADSNPGDWDRWYIYAEGRDDAVAAGEVLPCTKA